MLLSCKLLISGERLGFVTVLYYMLYLHSAYFTKILFFYCSSCAWIYILVWNGTATSGSWKWSSITGYYIWYFAIVQIRLKNPEMWNNFKVSSFLFSTPTKGYIVLVCFCSCLWHGVQIYVCWHFPVERKLCVSYSLQWYRKCLKG